MDYAKFTEVTPKQIKLLEAAELVDLIRCLLHCEASSAGLARPEIKVPPQITVADGGADAHWNNPIREEKRYLPRRFTRYQLKATKIANTDIEKELLKSKKVGIKERELKNRVAEVLEDGGAYIFITTHPWIKADPKHDLENLAADAFRKARFRLPKKAYVGLIDGNELTKWVNLYPAAIALVHRYTLNLGGMTYYTFSEWARMPNMVGDYFTNDALSKHLESIRGSLLKQQGLVMRITGLSGIGKTRLLLEALAPKEKDDFHGNCLSSQVVYLKGRDENGVLNLVQHLGRGKYEGIVVVDDCRRSLHSQLANSLLGDRLTLVTLYHEPESSTDERHLNLDEREVREAVTSIIKNHPNAKHLSQEQIKRLAQFCQGFPVVARMIVQLERVPNLQEFAQDELAAKLLGDGVERDDVCEHVYTAYSLFRRVVGSEDSTTEQEVFIRNEFSAGVPQQQFMSKRRQLYERRLLQSMGDFVFAVPRPIAVACAAEYFRSTSVGEWKERLDRIEEAGLTSAFCDRISDLETSPSARKVGELLSDPAAPFRKAEYLMKRDIGAQVFRALTTLNPEAGLEAISQALRNVSVSELASVESGRRDLLRALELITWYEDLFERGAKLILRFAEAENETWSNNSTGVFTQLFQLFLSGTQAPPEKRIALAKDVLTNGTEKQREIIVGALGNGMRDGGFNRMDDQTLEGKRDPAKDWRPSSQAEVNGYFASCFRLLAKEIINGGGLKEEAANQIASHLGSIVKTQLVFDLEDEFKELADLQQGLWPAAKESLRNVLDYRAKEMTPESKEAISRWIEYVTPKEVNLDAQLRDLVGSPGWHHVENEDGELVDISKAEAEELAETLVSEDVDLRDHLEVLLKGEQQQAFDFGAKLAELSPRIDEVVRAVLDEWPKLPEAERNPTFLRGIARGLLAGERDKRIALVRKIEKTPDLADLLIPIVCSGTLSAAELEIVCRAVAEGRIPESDFETLAFGSVTAGLDPDDVISQLRSLLEAKPGMVREVFKVLYMYCFRDASRFEASTPLFKELVVHPNLPRLERRWSHEWVETASRLMRAKVDEEWCLRLAKVIVEWVVQDNSYDPAFGLSRVTGLLFARAPKIVAPIFMEKLATSDDYSLYRLTHFLSRSGGHFDDSGSPLWELPPELFREWVKKNRKLMEVLIREMPLYREVTAEEPEQDLEKRGEGEGSSGSHPSSDDDHHPSLEWHPFALILLEEGVEMKDLAAALGSNLLSFSSTGSRVPYLEERKKLVDQLGSKGGPREREIARSVGREIDSEIKRQKRWDLNRQASMM